MAPRQSTVLRTLAIERGEATYYTGKPCKRGHDSPRRIHNNDCIACDRERAGEWYRAHPAEARAQWLRFLARRPGRVREYRLKTARKPENKARRKKQTAQHYQENIEAMRKKGREYGRAHPEKRRAWKEANHVHSRDYHNRRKYGIEPEQYSAVLDRQHGKCAICARTFGEARATKPHVDHCHAMGTFRGLLCLKCNTALGLLDDEPSRLRAAADYLDRRGVVE